VKKLLLILFILTIVIFADSQMIKYRVNQNKCITCGYCVQSKVCPVDAIHIVRGKAVIDREACIGCKLCQAGNQINYKGCPVGAFGPESQPVILKKSVNSSIDLTTQNPKPSNTKVIIAQGIKNTSSKHPSDTISITAKTNQTKTSKVSNTNTTKKATTTVLIYKVDPSICIGCQLCVHHCPANAIDFIDNKAIIDQSKCTHCGICKNGNQDDFAGCPVGAISATPSSK